MAMVRATGHKVVLCKFCQAYLEETGYTIYRAASIKGAYKKIGASKLGLTVGGGKFALTWGNIKGADYVEIWLQIDNEKWKNSRPCR